MIIERIEMNELCKEWKREGHLYNTKLEEWNKERLTDWMQVMKKWMKEDKKRDMKKNEDELKKMK